MIGIEVVGRVEVAFVLFEKEVYEAGRIRLQHDVAVEVGGVHDPVEIVVADVDVEVLAPVVLDAFEDQLVSASTSARR